MGLKAILESLDGLDEGLTGFYKEDGDKFVLDVENIDSHPKVRGVVTANKGNVAKRDKWKARAEELEAKVATFPEDFDPEEYASLKANASDDPDKTKAVNEQIQSLKATYENQIAGLKKKVEDVTAEKDVQIAERDSYIDRTVKDADLKQSLLDVGVDPKFLNATLALHKDAAKVVRDDDGSRRGIFETDLGEVPIGQFIKEWAETDQGKPFIKPATGPNANGSNGKSGSNTIKRSVFESMSQNERMAATKDGKKVVPD